MSIGWKQAGEVRTFIRGERHDYSCLVKCHPPRLHMANHIFRVGLLLLGPLWRDIEGKIRRPRINLPIEPVAFPALVQSQKYQMRKRYARVIVPDHIFLRLIEEVFGYVLLDVVVARMVQFRRRLCQRGKVIQKDEAGCGMFEGRGEEGVFGAQEREAV